MTSDSPPGARWARMSARLDRTLVRFGCSVDDRAGVLGACDRAGLHRASLLPPDEDDPRWLHPGRNVLILLEDAGARDPAWLALGAGFDQCTPELIPPEARGEVARVRLPLLPGGLFGTGEDARRSEDARGGAQADAGSGGASSADADSDAEELWLEEALLLPEGALLVLLADGLDHLRHLHLDQDPRTRAIGARRGEELLLPLACRVGGRLERRFRWWCSRVGASWGLAGPTDFDSS